MSSDFSIHMFLPSGTAEGIKIVEISNWVGRAVAGPRSRFEELRRRPEFAKTGVYVLVGQADPNGLPTVYVGEGDPVANRLINAGTDPTARLVSRVRELGQINRGRSG